MKAIRILLACIRKADATYNLINEGDKIILGLSGGKDSVALLYCLNLYKKFSNKSFTLQPVMIDMGFDNFDPTPMVELCKNLGYELIIHDSKEVYKILKIQKEKQNFKHLPCSICSRMRKAAINRVANDIGFDKVAFAHHANDAIETFYMNMLIGGKLETFSPKMFLENAKITFIRPFINAFEEDIIRLIKEENLPVLDKSCPADQNTNREVIKNVLADLFKAYPHSKENALTMLANYSKEDLFYNHINYQLDEFGNYIKPVVTPQDKVIELDLRIRIFMHEAGLDYQDEITVEHEKDYNAFIAFNKNDEPIGTIGYKVITDDLIKIERLAVLEKYRGQGYGRKIFAFLLDYILKKYYPKEIILHARTIYQKLYESFGFTTLDHPFYLGPMQLIKMIYKSDENIKHKKS